MNWIFPPNNGGRESGFHDAGVETFKGDNEKYLARELIQNSLDARLDDTKPVHVKFDLIEFHRDQIPGIDYLQDTFKRCEDFWKDHEKAKLFFNKSAKLERGGPVSDYAARFIRAVFFPKAGWVEFYQKYIYKGVSK